MPRHIYPLGLALLLLVGRAGLTRAAAPVIDSLQVTRTQVVYDSVPTNSQVQVLRFHDADGVADLTQVSFLAPCGAPCTFTVGTSQADASWEVVAPNTVELTLSCQVPWIDNGTLTYTVYDAGGLTDSVTTSAVPSFSETLHFTSPAVTGGLISGVLPSFAWAGAQPGASTTLTVSGERPYWRHDIWQYDAGSGASVDYDTDGTATDAQLVPGRPYAFYLASDLQTVGSDPRVLVRTLQHCYQNVLVYSADPVIECTGLLRRRDTVMPAWVMGSDEICMAVTDGDGYGTLTSFSYTDPTSLVHEFDTAMSPSPFHPLGDYTLHLMYDPESALLEDPPAGAYRFTARDLDGHVAELVTPPVPGDAGIQLLSPAVDGVTTDTTPTFAWSLPAGATPPTWP